MKKTMTLLLILLLLYITLPFLFKTGNPVLNTALVLAGVSFTGFWISLVFKKDKSIAAGSPFFEKYQPDIFFVLFCFFFYFAWAQLIPYNNAPDEEMRYSIARFIYTNGALPFGNEPEIVNPLWGQSYAYQPILAYQIAAIFMKAASFMGLTDSQLYLAARFSNTLIATGTVILVLSIGKKCFKAKGTYLFAVLVCCLPQFVFISSYVNNDTLALFSTALIVYSWILGMERHWDLKSCVVLGIGISLCFLSYYNAYGFILCSVLLYAGDYLINRKEWPLKNFLCAGLLIIGICAVLAGWWFIRNALLHDGDFFGMRTSAALAEQLAQAAYKPSQHVTPASSGYSILKMLFRSFQPPGQSVSPPWLYVTYISFLGNFGFMSIPMTKLAYVLLTLIFWTAGISAVFWWFREGRKTDAARGKLWHALLILSILAPFCLSIWYSYSSDYQPQGRYVMTILIPLMYFLTRGLLLLEQRLKARQMAIPVTLLVIFTETVVAFYALCGNLAAAVLKI